MIVVSDTSSLTALLQIGRIELLRELYVEVFVPDAVQQELSREHASLPAFIRRETVRNQNEVRRLLHLLDIGEAEAIVLAKELRADALLIDELEGRRIAAQEGVPYIGLLGVLVRAKHKRLIVSVREVMIELETRAGFRLSEEIKAVALRHAGER